MLRGACGQGDTWARAHLLPHRPNRQPPTPNRSRTTFAQVGTSVPAGPRIPASPASPSIQPSIQHSVLDSALDPALRPLRLFLLRPTGQLINRSTPPFLPLPLTPPLTLCLRPHSSTQPSTLPSIPTSTQPSTLPSTLLPNHRSANSVRTAPLLLPKSHPWDAEQVVDQRTVAIGVFIHLGQQLSRVA